MFHPLSLWGEGKGPWAAPGAKVLQAVVKVDEVMEEAQQPAGATSLLSPGLFRKRDPIKGASSTHVPSQENSSAAFSSGRMRMWPQDLLPFLQASFQGERVAEDQPASLKRWPATLPHCLRLPRGKGLAVFVTKRVILRRRVPRITERIFISGCSERKAGAFKTTLEYWKSLHLVKA